MKSISISLLASIALTLNSFAGPKLLIATTITDGDNRVLSAPTMVIASGTEATIATGELDSRLTYGLTPTLLDNGSVELQTVITQQDGKETNKLQVPRIIIDLGKTAEIKVGKEIFTLKPSLVK